MDFFEPIRRLFALQNSNPSIRQAAAPKPQQPQQQWRYVQRADKGFDFYNGNQKTYIDDYVKATNANKNELVKKLAYAGDPVSQKALRQPAQKPAITAMPAAFPDTLATPGQNTPVLQKQNLRQSVVDRVAKGEVVPFQAPNMVSKGPQLSRQEYDDAVKEGIKQKVAIQNGGTPFERAQDQVGHLDFFSMLQNVARLPEKIVRSGAQLVDPKGNYSNENQNAYGSPLRFLYGRDGVQTYQQEGQETSKGLYKLTGNEGKDSTVAGNIIAAASAALDIGGLGLGKFAKDMGKNATEKIIKQFTSSTQDKVEQELGRSLTDGETKQLSDNIAARIRDEAKKPDELTQNLPPEDVDAIKQAGGKLPEPTLPEPKLPQEDINAILQAGGDVHLNLPKTPRASDIASTMGPGQTKPELGLNQQLEDVIGQAPKQATDTTLPQPAPDIPQQNKVDEAVAQVTPPTEESVVNPAPSATPDAQAVQDVSKAQTGTVAPTPDGQPAVAKPSQGDIPSTADQASVNGVATGTQAEPTTGPLPQKAEDIVPNADENTKKAVQDVLDSLKSAEGSYNDVSKIRAGEKASRAAKGANLYDSAGGGEEGFRAKLSALKGKYSESAFNPISASDETQRTILDDIEKSSLRDFEKINTQNAIRKIWGANPEKPTQSDVNYIRKYFGDDLADAVDTAVKETPSTWRDTVAKIAGTPRALMATGDLSFGGRQGAPLGARFPKEWGKANVESAKYAVNKGYFDKSMKDIVDSDEYGLISDKMKVALPAADSNGMEEGFAAADYAEKIPGFGKIVSGSDRAYAGGLTKLRYEAAKNIIDKSGGVDEMMKVYQDVYGDKADEAFKALGEVINTFSGRGGKQGGLLDKHMKTLSTTLFAPRLWAAKLNSLNPVFYARLAKTNPDAAKLALRTQATFLTMAGTVLSLASAAGATVVWDPRSSDFAKIKVGNTRYDILGGLQQNIVLGARMLTGEKINSETGEKDTLGDGITTPTRKDLLYQAFENKENPLLSYATRLLQTKTDSSGGLVDTYGNDFNLGMETAKLGIPLGVQGVADTTADTGDFGKSVAMNAPGFFGVGVQTYGNMATKDKGTDEKGKLIFKGEVKPDMVTDNNGKVMLDAKGKPIKIKIDPNATKTEIQALKDEARRKAYKSQYTRDQSKEDQALMKLSDKELTDYVKNGTINQDKADAIARLKKGADIAGGNVDVPKSVQSNEAKDFYRKYNSMTKKDQAEWLKATPDDNSKKITDYLNKNRPEGLSEYKASNEIAKRYAEYEKDIYDHPEYTKVDKLNKVKDFQADVYKTNYSTDQRDIYAEGGSSDMRTLIENGSVSKADLDEAIKMDNELYASGLTGSLKFSKKFRSQYGYDTPATGGGSGGGSSKETSPHLAELLPKASTGTEKEVPQFSSKRRTQGISFKDVSLPKSSSSGRKVTIRL